MGDGLFLECCKEVSKKYPDIGFEGVCQCGCVPVCMLICRLSFLRVFVCYRFILHVCSHARLHGFSHYIIHFSFSSSQVWSWTTRVCSWYQNLSNSTFSFALICMATSSATSFADWRVEQVLHRASTLVRSENKSMVRSENKSMVSMVRSKYGKYGKIWE